MGLLVIPLLSRPDSRLVQTARMAGMRWIHNRFRRKQICPFAFFGFRDWQDVRSWAGLSAMKRSPVSSGPRTRRCGQRTPGMRLPVSIPRGRDGAGCPDRQMVRNPRILASCASVDLKCGSIPRLAGMLTFASESPCCDSVDTPHELIRGRTKLQRFQKVKELSVVSLQIPQPCKQFPLQSSPDSKHGCCGAGILIQIPGTRGGLAIWGRASRRVPALNARNGSLTLASGRPPASRQTSARGESTQASMQGETARFARIAPSSVAGSAVKCRKNPPSSTRPTHQARRSCEFSCLFSCPSC